jgi:hypothetical protein
MLQYSNYMPLFPSSFKDFVSSQEAVDFVQEKFAGVSLFTHSSLF